MRAEALTPADIFGYHVRYVVPLFQRPYVWNQVDQWEPLWEDVRAVAERLLRLWPVLARPAGAGPLDQLAQSELSRLVGPHFLGAIVVEQAPTLVGSIQVYHVIDGQQRLTTLQLLLDAAGRVAEKYGDPDDARRLRQLVVNDPAVRRDDELGKVWPSIGDRDAYLATVVGGPAAHQPDAPVAAAHAFFVEAIRSWAHEDQSAGEIGVRLHVLARAISGYLRAVVIHLDPGDNAQGIFETLNHRGAPLLAADLIKNLVFRVAQGEGLDVVALYQKYWADLDGPYWRSYVTRGRQVVPRIDVFVHYWLIMRLVREVRSDQIFVSFRDELGQAGAQIEDLLRELAHDARTYADIAVAATGSSGPHQSIVDHFCYRVFGALEAGAVTPFYLWLMRWPASRLPVAERDRALVAMESWLVRRWLCGLSTKDNSNVVMDLVRALDAAGPETAGQVTERYCQDQTSVSRQWPGDDAVRKALKTMPLDARVVRPRLRMVLEALEDHRRADRGEGACERDLSVEHVLPLDWRSHWAPTGIPSGTAVLRDTASHTLGNLTLVRAKLTAEQSGLPWSDAAAKTQGLGGTGKRTELAQHSQLRLNTDVLSRESWTEATIAERTTALADEIVRVWPRPTTASAFSSSSAGAVAGSASIPPPPRSSGRAGTVAPSSPLPTPSSSATHAPPPPAPPPVPVQRTVVVSRNVWSGEGFSAMDDLSYLDDPTLDADDAVDDGDAAADAYPAAHWPDRGAISSDVDGTGEGDPGADGDPARTVGSVGTVGTVDTVDNGDDRDAEVDDAGYPGRDPDTGDPDTGDDGSGAASRYALLVTFLSAQTADTVPMTFEQLEDVMQDPLPPSARTSIPFWSSTNVALGRAIVAGGFKPTNVDLWNERVIFARDAPGRRPRRPQKNARRRGGRSGLDR